MSRRPRKLGKNEGGAMEAQETTSKTEEMGTVCEVFSPENEGGAMEAQETTSKTEEMGTVCEVCPDEGTDKKASTYCTDCQQRFCSRCARIHSSQKASKQHKLIDIADMQKLLDSSIEELCESCLNMGESNLARMYCAECDEKLCVECSALHGKTKITKSHLRITIEEFKKTQQSLKVVCMQCNKNGEQTEISQYCPVCEKDLCLECTQIHKTSKSTKQHELMDIQSKHTELTRNKARVAILCEPCKNTRKNRIASDVCKECEEFLCEICARTHKRLKATKMHHLIKAENVLQEYCEPCMSNGDRLIASRLCKHCDELLCSSCSEMHASLKATKSHTLGNIPLKISDLHSCYPCKVSDREVNAVHHCAEREEIHCSTYGEVHGRKKAALSHNVVEVDKMGKSKNERDYKGGGVGLGVLKLELDEIEPDVLKSPFGEVKSDALESEFGEMELDKGQSEFKYPPKSDRLNQESNEPMVLEPPEQGQGLPLEALLQRGGGFNPAVDIPPDADDETMVELAIALSLQDQDTDMDKRPGPPLPCDVQSDSIELFWAHPKIRPKRPVKEYEIRYKEVPNSEWRRYSEFPDRACVRIKGLKSRCSYKFKVRADYGNTVSQYSPESTSITTKESLASVLLRDFTIKEKEGGEGTPSVNRLLGTEIKDSRNEKAKTRKIELGTQPVTGAFEKTILLVGETGSGKSTLVNVFINFIAGVNYEDPFRLTLVDLEDEEKGKSQANSQTEWVTCYTIHPIPGSRIQYTLNIIDTPGFGDTRGVDKDKGIFYQLGQLFSSKGEKGLVFIDAACFVTKAPNVRLTDTQRYIYKIVFSLFGQDIENNICALITFADSKKPQVLSTLKEAKLQIKSWYVFNNSVFFEDNDQTSHARAFWEMGIKSFQKFFQDLKKMKSKSLHMTKEVLENRSKMELTLSNLQPQIIEGLRKQEEVRKEMRIIEMHEREIASNKAFKYTVKEIHKQRSDLPKGEFATNCSNCNVTCHLGCWPRKDFLNYFCSAMDWRGNCTVCEGKCTFIEHTNTSFVYRFVQKEVTKTFDEELKKYETAMKQKLTHEQYLEAKKKDCSDLETTVSSMMKEVHQITINLSKIALQPNIKSLKEYIDIMIQSAEIEKKEGYQEVIAALIRHRDSIEIDKSGARSKEGMAATKTAENQKTHGLTGKHENKRVLSKCYPIA